MRRLAAILAVAGMTACATLQPPPATSPAGLAAYQARAQALTEWTSWSFRGRLSIDNGEDGGSGRLTWRVRDDASQLDFRGAMGQGAWRLNITPGRALLERGDGSRVESGDLAGLVRAEVGWTVPVDALRFWVLGLEAPGGIEQMIADPQGRIQRLVQRGWTIEFDRYQQTEGVELPGRIEAVRESFRIKLVAAAWARDVAEPEGA